MMLQDMASPFAAAAAGWALATTLAAVVAAVAAAVLWRRLRRCERRLYTERMDRQQVEALAPTPDAWLWQTDARHRLMRLQPPAAGVRQSHADQWIGQPLTDLLRAIDGPSVLVAALQRETDLPATACTWAAPTASGSAPSRPMTVRAVAQHDADGCFRGHLGLLHAERSPAGAAGPAAGMPGGFVPGATAGAIEASALAPATPLMPTADQIAAEQASFTYTVTHDLRAPIRVVEGFTRIVKEDYGALLDRMGLDHLDRVLGAAARMNAMIDALLALSRLSQQPLSRQPVNLSRLAEYIVDDLRRTSPERAVRITVEPGMTAEGDPTLLRMALENLLGNAWKYTGKARDPQIWFQRDPAAPEAVFQVRDNGAGFDMRFADRLFGVFQRLHSASEFPGTGVGLASVQRIVRRHGGDIWAESAVGRGTTFRFTLGQPMIHDMGVPTPTAVPRHPGADGATRSTAATATATAAAATAGLAAAVVAPAEAAATTPVPTAAPGAPGAPGAGTEEPVTDSAAAS